MTLHLIHEYCRIQRNGKLVYCATNQNECIKGGHLDLNCFGEIKEIILRIELDEVHKLRYALEHFQLTGDEHIDAVLSTFNEVLKEELKNVCRGFL